MTSSAYWNPSGTGPATLTGMDGTVSTMLELNVEHGRAIDLAFQLEPRQPSAGEQVVLQLVAEDVKGNRWVVDGDITMGMGAAENSQKTPRIP